MQVVVCIKQVPDTANVRIDPVTHTLIREGVPAVVNPFDLYAIEEGLRVREKTGGKVTVLTMGPRQAEAALREALSMGVDQAVLLSDRAFAGSDTWATSFVLAAAIRKVGAVDLVICGKQASDGDTGQVGPGLAAHLDFPQITYVRKIEALESGRLVAQRLLETGYEVIEASLPCVITVVKEINEPRLPSLKGKLAARQATIPVWTAADVDLGGVPVGLEGSPTRVVRIFSPEPRQAGEILSGDPRDVAERLAEKLSALVMAASRRR